MKKKLIVALALAAIAVVCTFQVACAEESGISVTSHSAYLADEYGREIYSYNADAKHEIASMVKIMTATLVFESIDRGDLSVDEKITVSEEASGMGGSQMFLDAGSEYPVGDLLKGVIVASANDASYALAERVAGSADAFVAMMNEKASQLGMSGTKFANCTGLPSQSEQYSTARDVNTMTRELMKHDLYFEYSSIWTEDYVHPSGRVTNLTNTNKLIRQYQGCKGGKTGYTDNAGFCLSACAERNGVSAVATIIGAADSKTRFAECSRLLNYAFANCRYESVLDQGQSADIEIKVKSGKTKTVVPVAAEKVGMSLMRGEELTVEYVPYDVKAPVAKGDVIAKAIVTCGDRRAEFDLVSPIDIEKASWLDFIRDIADRW